MTGERARGGRPRSSKMPTSEVDVVITCGACGWRGRVSDPPVCGRCGASLAVAAAVARDARAAFDALSRPQPSGPLMNGRGRPRSA